MLNITRALKTVLKTLTKSLEEIPILRGYYQSYNYDGCIIFSITRVPGTITKTLAIIFGRIGYPKSSWISRIVYLQWLLYTQHQ